MVLHPRLPPDGRLKCTLRIERGLRKLPRQVKRDRGSDGLRREKQKIQVAFHPEFVMRNGIRIGIMQVPVPQQEHAGISEIAEN
jgi:hypothetical protein